MCEPISSLHWEELRARKSLPNCMVLYWVRNSGKRLSLIYHFGWFWFCIDLGCRSLSISFWISHKENLPLNCCWIDMFSGGEFMASYSILLMSLSQHGFYFTLIFHSFIVGRILDCWLFCLSILKTFLCLLDSLVVNEMPILKLIFTHLSVISSLSSCFKHIVFGILRFYSNMCILN